jgi:tRNA uridine 5-carboxymethylaminomethyl modification enzyme
MFTSRAEYRLLLREDNAAERLVEEGARCGLIDERRARGVADEAARVRAAAARLASCALAPSAESNARLRELGLPEVRKPTSLETLLRREGVRALDLAPLAHWLTELTPETLTRLEVCVKYDGYLEQQRARAERLQRIEGVRIPAAVDYAGIPGLKAEAVEKLSRARPATLGQAGRIPGITPAAVEILRVYCRRSC